MTESNSPEAPEGAGPAPITVYWRPGCGFCSALFRRLDKAGVDYTKLDIWGDPEAAAFVRSVARGNETVPTVVVGDTALVNPPARRVLDLAGYHETEAGGWVRRALKAAQVGRATTDKGTNRATDAEK